MNRRSIVAAVLLSLVLAAMPGFAGPAATPTVSAPAPFELGSAPADLPAWLQPVTSTPTAPQVPGTVPTPIPMCGTCTHSFCNHCVTWNQHCAVVSCQCLCVN